MIPVVAFVIGAFNGTWIHESLGNFPCNIRRERRSHSVIQQFPIRHQFSIRLIFHQNFFLSQKRWSGTNSTLITMIMTAVATVAFTFGHIIGYHIPTQNGIIHQRMTEHGQRPQKRTFVRIPCLFFRGIMQGEKTISIFLLTRMEQFVQQLFQHGHRTIIIVIVKIIIIVIVSTTSATSAKPSSAKTIHTVRFRPSVKSTFDRIPRRHNPDPFERIAVITSRGDEHGG
mmetsp:Transcript_8657/g.18004  ORF Transcript_8657/g.18004 Transcript_8657/m.18004 type:complete len:228 (+) Transcript_8657:468-1151(+)